MDIYMHRNWAKCKMLNDVNCHMLLVAVVWIEKFCSNLNIFWWHPCVSWFPSFNLREMKQRIAFLSQLELLQSRKQLLVLLQKLKSPIWHSPLFMNFIIHFCSHKVFSPALLLVLWWLDQFFTLDKVDAASYSWAGPPGSLRPLSSQLRPIYHSRMCL